MKFTPARTIHQNQHSMDSSLIHDVSDRCDSPCSFIEPPPEPEKIQPWRCWHKFVEATEGGEELVFLKEAADYDVNLGGY